MGGFAQNILYLLFLCREQLQFKATNSKFHRNHTNHLQSVNRDKEIASLNTKKFVNKPLQEMQCQYTYMEQKSIKRSGSFAEYFSNSFQEMATLKENQKRNADAFLKALDDWRHAQIHYAKRINDVAQFVYSIDRSKTGMYALYQQLHETLNMLATQAKNLALKIEDDIVIEMRELTKKLNSELGISLDAERHSRRSLMNKRAVIERVSGEYQACKRTLEDNQILNIVISNSCESNLDKRLKQSQKALESEKEFKLLDFKYREVLNEYNDCLTTHSSIIESILDKFQKQQVELIRCTHESILKAELHLSTMHKTICHEIDRVSQTTTNFNYESCLVETVDRYSNTTQGDLQPMTYTPYSSFISESVRSMVDRSLDGLIQKCKNKQVKQLIEKAIRTPGLTSQIEDKELKKFVEVFTSILEGGQMQKLEEFKGLLANPVNRAYFVACLQQYRLIGKFVMEEKSINNLKKMTMLFLDQCLENRDAYLAKQVMALLFTYFYIDQQDQQKPKVYLQQLVKQHPIWEQRDFWESALLMCIYEEKKNMLNQNIEQKEHEIESERNAIFNQLTCIPHNMVLFGIHQKQAKTFANKYVKFFNLSSRLKDIEKNIESASSREDDLSKKSSSNSNKSEVFTGSSIFSRAAERTQQPILIRGSSKTLRDS